MSAPSQSTPPPNLRRPFQDVPPPEPFFKTREFALFVRLGILAVFVLAAVLLYLPTLEKRATDETAAQQHAAAAPKVIVTPEQAQARETALFSKFEGALTDSKNGDDFKITPGYLKLLETLIKYSPDDLAAKAQKDLVWADVKADPEGWRGEFVRVRGIVGDHWAIKLPRPVLGRTDVYRSLLSDSEDALIFDMTEFPTDIDLSREVVDVEGIFYRTVKFENAAPLEGQKEAKIELPYLLARNIRKVPPAVDTGMRAFLQQHTLGIVGVIAFVITVATLLFLLVQSKNRRRKAPAPAPTSIREMLEQKLREEGHVPPPPQ